MKELSIHFVNMKNEAGLRPMKHLLRKYCGNFFYDVQKVNFFRILLFDCRSTSYHNVHGVNASWQHVAASFFMRGACFIKIKLPRCRFSEHLETLLMQGRCPLRRFVLPASCQCGGAECVSRHWREVCIPHPEARAPFYSLWVFTLIVISLTAGDRCYAMR